MKDITCVVCNGTNVDVMAESVVSELLRGSFVEGTFVATSSFQEGQDYTEYYSFCNDCYNRVTLNVEW